MKIFKGWFFYLVVALLMVVVATFASNYYARQSKNKVAEKNILSKVPILEINLDKNWLTGQTNISSGTRQDLLENAKKAAQKIASEIPEKLENSSAVKTWFFNYLIENKPFLSQQGFDFTKGADKSWDFTYKTGHGAVKLFSLKP